MPAVIILSFDPLIQVGDLVVRWQTVGVTVALLIGLAVAATRRRHSPDAQRPERAAAGRHGLHPAWRGARRGGRRARRARHRLLGVLCGRPCRLLDVSVGALSLTGAVIGGTISGLYIARIIGAPARRWADAAVVPLLLTLGIGKLAQLLGGSGQGTFFDGAWAVAFAPPGPWVSPLPAVPAHPSQVYEGLWLLLALPLIVLWLFRERASRERMAALGAAISAADCSWPSWSGSCWGGSSSASHGATTKSWAH